MIRRSHTECKFYHIWVTGINEEKKKKTQDTMMLSAKDSF